MLVGESREGLIPSEVASHVANGGDGELSFEEFFGALVNYSQDLGLQP